jgi:hypothetical protein
MASLTPKTLFIGNTSAANVYTVNSTAGNYTIVRNINICNANTSTDKTITIHLIAPAGTAVENNKYLSALPVKANDSVQIDTGLILSNGYSIYISHTGNVTTTITGVEYLG